MHRTRNAAYGQPYRGFKSLPLRQLALILLSFHGFFSMCPCLYPFRDGGQKKPSKTSQQGGQSHSRLRLSGTICAVLLFSSQLALAQFTQQGPKLVGSGAAGPAQQGYSVALSADGNTAIVGGPSTTLPPGRRGSSSAAAMSGPAGQQAGRHRRGLWGRRPRLRPSRCPATATPPSWAGLDNRTGAAWVFTRSGGVWTQQGSKLVGTGAVGTPTKAGPSRCPPTATPPSWARPDDNGRRGGMGLTPAAAVSGPSRAASWSAPARLEPDQG